MIRNWKTRVFEVWSDSITYRAENSPDILGGVILSPKSEIITDGRIARKRDRFPDDPPHPYYCGIYERKKTLWVSSDSEELINKFKIDVQEAINASVMREDLEVTQQGYCSMS